MRRLAISAIVVISALLFPAAALAATGPALVGSLADSSDLSGATAVAVSGPYAYTTAYWPGQLTVLDISTPSAPIVVGSTPATASLQNGSNVTIVGTDAFVVSKNRNASTTSNDDGSGNSLTVVDISNPKSPTVDGTIHDSSRLFGAYGIAVQGHYAFVASQGLVSFQPTSPDTSAGSFSVIDLNRLSAGVVANIDNRSLTGRLTNALEHATSVAISGHYAYVTAYLSGRLTIVDIANPLSPVIVASLADWTHLAYDVDVAVQGSYGYVVDQTDPGFTDQLSVVDLSNPAKPSVVGSLSSGLLSGAYRVRVRGSLAFVAASSASTIAAIDISNPASPRLAGSVTDSARLNFSTGLDLDSSGRYVIAASVGQAGQPVAKYPPYPGQSGGRIDTGTISVIDLDPSPISVTIAPSSEPSSRTMKNSARFGFSVDDDVSTVRCGLDGAALRPCSTPTSQQYHQLSPGSHAFTVQATDAAGHTATDRYAWTMYGVPRDASRPTIAVTRGQLKAGAGAWSGYPAPAFAYRWMRCDLRGANCKVIRGETGTRRKITARDFGSRFRFTVVARNSVGSSSAVSAATAAVSDTPRTRNASLIGVSKRKARLDVTILAGPNGPLLKKLVIALSQGLSFSKERQSTAKGVSVLDPRGKRVRFEAVVSRGSLVLTLKRSTASLELLIEPSGLEVSTHLATSVREKHTKTLGITVTLAGNDHPRTHARLKLRGS